MSEWDSLILIFFLLKTLLVPTKKFPVAGLRPQTIAGAPSIFADMLLSAVNQSKTDRSPVRMASSGCSMCVFFILLQRFQRPPFLFDYTFAFFHIGSGAQAPNYLQIPRYGFFSCCYIRTLAMTGLKAQKKSTLQRGCLRCGLNQSPGQAEKSISSPRCQLIVSLTPMSKIKVKCLWMASLGASSSNRIQTQ